MVERMDTLGLAAVMFIATLVVIGIPLFLAWTIFG
jgi:hypothetical protein